MSHVELYRLARAGDPACIEGLLDLITQAALEILRLECKYERNQSTPMEESVLAAKFTRTYNLTRMNMEVYASRIFK